MLTGLTPTPEHFLRWLDEPRMRAYGFPTGAQFRAGAAQWEEDGVPANLLEEQATIRLMLRQIERRSEVCSGDRESMRLVDLYGLLYVRLARLLKLDGGEKRKVLRFHRYLVDTAIREVRKELGRDK